MPIPEVIVGICGALVCMLICRRMALSRNRSQGAWMWWAALFGPIPIIVLACLPAKPQ